jgi:hypothetical protein
MKIIGLRGIQGSTESRPTMKNIWAAQQHRPTLKMIFFASLRLW